MNQKFTQQIMRKNGFDFISWFINLIIRVSGGKVGEGKEGGVKLSSSSNYSHCAVMKLNLIFIIFVYIQYICKSLNRKHREKIQQHNQLVEKEMEKKEQQKNKTHENDLYDVVV